MSALLAERAETTLSDSLQAFLNEWDQAYQSQIQEIPLFQEKFIKTWDENKIKHFVRILYHARGHFHDVLWYMGNFAPDKRAKQIILDNIEDEFNLNGFSHEQLYLMFAKSVGVDLTYERIEQKYYLPFLREFNQGHIQWLMEHDWDERIAFFAALERLDNIDYYTGKMVAKILGVEERHLTFFNAHIKADHFGPIFSEFLLDLWSKKEDVVRNAFDFIARYQLSMWLKMSHTLRENICEQE